MAIKIAMIADYPENVEQIDGGVQAVTCYLVNAMAQMPEIELHVLSFKRGIDRSVVVRESGITRYSIPLGRLGTFTNFRKGLSDDTARPYLAYGSPELPGT